MARKSDPKSKELAAAMVALVRSFGLHRPDETPCGEPVPVAEAHALMDLAADGPLNHGELASRLRLEKSTRFQPIPTSPTPRAMVPFSS